MALAQAQTKLSSLALRSGQRGVVLGQTGSGKSWFVRAIIGAYVGRRQVVILDSKHDPVWSRIKGARYVSTLAGVQHCKFPRIPIVVWRPHGLEAHNFDTYDNFYSWAYERGNTVIVVDEVAQTVNGPTSYGPGFADLVCRGRVRGLVCYFGTQRPVLLPRIIFSESNKFYSFFITDRRDRQTIAAFSDARLEGKVPDRHGFHFYDVSTRTYEYFSGLDLK